MTTTFPSTSPNGTVSNSAVSNETAIAEAADRSDRAVVTMSEVTATTPQRRSPLTRLCELVAADGVDVHTSSIAEFVDAARHVGISPVLLTIIEDGSEAAAVRARAFGMAASAFAFAAR